MDDEIVRRYVAELNPNSAYLPGVPLRDLTRGEYEALPGWLQASVDRCGFYQFHQTVNEGEGVKHG